MAEHANTTKKAEPTIVGRRTFLKTAALAPIIASAVQVSPGMVGPSAADPLSSAIADFRNGSARFDTIKEAEWDGLGGEEKVISMTYGEPLDRLEYWSEPAETREAALTALRFALDEARQFESSPTVVPMLEASLAFFESEI